MDVPVFHIGDSVIKQANCIKLLGILVQEDLGRNTQVGSMCTKFNRKLFFLRMLKHCNLPRADLVTIYLQYVRPTLEYASPVWFCGFVV